MKEVICGIYKIENLINHKKYIGQSVDIYDRWWHHKNIVKQPYDIEHYSAIHKAIKYYGIENFSFEIIEECSPKELNNREIYWIAYYHTWVLDPQCNGYNLTNGGEGSSRKAVDQYDLLGNFIRTFTSITEAAHSTNINMPRIGMCINKQAKTAGGFQWRLHNEEPPGPVKYYRGNKKISKNNSNNPYKINQYDKNGNYINTFDTAKDAALSLNKDRSNHISECCIGKRKSAYGFIWKYADKDI